MDVRKMENHAIFRTIEGFASFFLEDIDLFRFISAVCAMILMVSPVSASPVFWEFDFTATDTVNNVAVLTLNGSFIYDFDTDTLSNISILRDGGTIYDEDGRAYPGIIGVQSGFVFASEPLNTIGPTVRAFAIDANLTNAGGLLVLDTSVNPDVVDFSIPNFIGCGSFVTFCDAGFFEDNFLAFTGEFTGTLSGTPVIPLPGAAVLLIAALTGLAAVGRRRT